MADKMLGDVIYQICVSFLIMKSVTLTAQNPRCFLAMQTTILRTYYITTDPDALLRVHAPL